jgi:hypothetical protein
MIQAKQNDKEEKRSELSHEKDGLEKKKKKIEDKLMMISTLIAERKQSVASKVISDNKNALVVQIEKLHEIFNQAKVNHRKATQ